MIPDEPVRGRPPPPWFWALSGIERYRAMNRGQLTAVPLSRLLGIRAPHVFPGGINATMPATEALLAANGQLEIIPFLVATLEVACDAAVESGMRVEPRKFCLDPFRPAWLRPGNLVARARVVNSSNLFVFAEVQVEDPDGRHLAQGSMRAAIRRVEPAPPPPPDTLPRAEEPSYETPDPYLRTFATSPLQEVYESDGMAVVRRFADGTLELPATRTLDVRWEEYAEGRVALSMPASEWFCALDASVSPAAIAALADMAGWGAATTIHQAGRSLVGLEGMVRFLRPIRADGRRLLAESTVTEHVPDRFLAEGTIRDADGHLVAVGSASFERLDAERRESRRGKESRRVLATLLFTDIADSTRHAERLGDARWRALLDEHRLAVRREVSRHNGTEVDTAGDGFFVRFESPGQAIEAARAALRATARLGIALRAGVHTGECELEGNRPAGMAVHVAARIQAAAEPGEVLVSSTVRDLAAGSGLRFADRGERTLKGVPDPWRLYVVVE